MNAIVKTIITVALVVGISELAKRSSLFGAVLASIPLVSVLAMIWLYIDTGDIQAVSQLSKSIFWLVIPSLVLFISLPVFIKLGIRFSFSLILSISLTVTCYIIMIWLLKRHNITL